MGLIDVDELLKYANEEITSVFAYPQGQRVDEEKAHREMWSNIRKILLSAPTIEAEPIKHGKWLIGVGENGEPIGTYCSECGWSWERNIAAIQLNKVLSRIETPRCPNCGAKMDEV